jgi:hypothetical protein
MLVLLVCTSDAVLTLGFFVEVRLFSNLTCKFHTFITYYLTHMSSITLMIISVDRTIVVSNCSSFLSIFKRNNVINKPSERSNLIRKYSIKNKDNLTNIKKSYQPMVKLNKVNKTFLILAIVLAIINSHYLFKMNLSLTDEFSDSLNLTFVEKETIIYKNIKIPQDIYLIDAILYNANESSQFRRNKYITCFPFQGSSYFFFLDSIWIWIDAFLYSIFPFLVMIASSIFILNEINRKSREMHISIRINKCLIKRRSKRNKQLLVMLTVTNIFFILCSLPLCIIMIYNKMNGNSKKQHFIKTFFHLMAYSNNSFNFLFYILFSQKYRLVLSSLLRKIAGLNDIRNESHIKKRDTEGFVTLGQTNQIQTRFYERKFTEPNLKLIYDKRKLTLISTNSFQTMISRALSANSNLNHSNSISTIKTMNY